MNRTVQLLTTVAALGLLPAAAFAQAPDAAGGPPSGSLGAQFAALRSPAAEPLGTPAAAPDRASAPVARRVIDAAGTYDAYMRQASALGPHFADGAAVARAVGAGAAYEPRQLGEGAVAYVALAALQDPAFVEAVREAGAGPGGAELADRLLAEPRAVLDLPGADETAARTAALAGARGGALTDAGLAMRKAAYSVQREPWSKGAVADAGGRLSRVKLASTPHGALSAGETDALMKSLVGLRRPGVSVAPGAGPPTAAVTRGLAIAALAVLGRGGEDHAQAVGGLLADPGGVDCLKMAKLNLYQCLAVAGPHYEDMFCLGQHALADTGRCMAASAGWRGPLAAAPVLTAARGPLPPAAAPASVAVPLATAALDGPERASAFAAPPPPEPAFEPAPEPAAYEMARADVPTFDTTPRRVAERDDEDRGPADPGLSGQSLRDQGYDDWGRPLDPAADGAYAPREAPRGYADPGYYLHAGYGRPGPSDR